MLLPPLRHRRGGRVGGRRMSRKLHMIGNAHIDPVWLWQWPEGYQEVRATFQSAIDRLDEYPDFVFTCDSSLFFAWVEESDPELFARIKEHVSRRAASRWWAAGGSSRTATSPAASRSCARRSTASATCARSSGSRRRSARTWTRSATTRRSRRSCARAAATRTSSSARGRRRRSSRARSSGGSRPTARACSPTGSRTSTARRRTTSASTSRRRWRRCRTTTRTTPSSTASATTAAARRRRTSTRSRAMGLGSRARCGAFFDAAARRTASRPVVARRAPAPRAGLLHDATPGSSAGTAARRTCSSARRSGARSPTRSAFARIPHAELTERLEAPALQPVPRHARRLLDRARLRGRARPDRPRLVARGGRLQRRRPVDRPPDRDRARGAGDAAGRRLQPARVAAAGRRRAGVHLDARAGPSRRRRRGRAGADAADAAADDDERDARAGSPSRWCVPPLGYRTYRDPPRRRSRASRSPATDTHLENEHIRLELDPATGRIATARAQGERAPTWPRRPRGTPSSSTTAATPGATASPHTTASSASSSASAVRLLETGPVRAIVRVESRYGSSTLREDYVLSAGAAHVDVRVALDWHEPLKLLKLRYPDARSRPTAATFEIALRPRRARRRAATRSRARRGSTSRTAAAASPCINDAKYGYDVRRRRHRHQRRAQPGLGVARPARARGGRRLRVHGPGPADLPRPPRPARAATGATPASSRRAAELNQPPFALIETFHDGPLPQRSSFAADEGGDVVIDRAQGRRGRRLRSSCAPTSRPGSGGRGVELPLLDRDGRGRVRPARDQDVRAPARRASARRDGPARVVSSLDGDDWQLRGWLGDEWRWHVNKPWDAPGWLPARVPGSVLDDLDARRRAARPLPRAQQPARGVGAGARRGSTGGPCPARAASASRASTTRRRSSSTGRRSARHEGAFTPFEVERPRRGAAARGRRPRGAGERAAGGRDVAACACTRAGWATAGTSARAWSTRASGGRSTLDPPAERLPGRHARGRHRHRRGGRRGRAPRRLAASSGGRTGWASSASTTPGGFEVGFREVSFDGYALRRQRRRGAGARAGTGCRSTRSTACRGPRSSRTCSGLAARAGVNLLRVWGGGLIETPEFYELCDRLGLLVWQEFSQSSSGIESVPSDDPAFVAAMVADAREIVPRLRRHPSLAIWCGGNELDATTRRPCSRR